MEGARIGSRIAVGGAVIALLLTAGGSVGELPWATTGDHVLGVGHWATPVRLDGSRVVEVVAGRGWGSPVDATPTGSALGRASFESASGPNHADVVIRPRTTPLGV